MMASQSKPFLARIRRYFKAYGGWSSVLHSPLFIFSLILSAISYHSWVEDRWTSVAQSIIPNLLGFSLGTYALLFSLMTSRLKRALKAVKNENNVTYLDEINATFFHFIFVQVLSLMWSFLYQSTIIYDISLLTDFRFSSATRIFQTMQYVGGFVGFAMLVYSLTLVVGSALAVYRLALIVDPSPEQ